jgi:hypothetical protein
MLHTDSTCSRVQCYAATTARSASSMPSRCNAVHAVLLSTCAALCCAVLQDTWASVPANVLSSGMLTEALTETASLTRPQALQWLQAKWAAIRKATNVSQCLGLQRMGCL